jgi:6-phosphogluconate dehydrogenase
MNKCDIGIYGLGVMGQNLSLNFASRGFSVAVYNRREADEENITNTFITTKCQGKKIIGTRNLEDFINSISLPRKIMLLVSTGNAVDEVINQITPFLDVDDIVIDGGNSHYRDTARHLSQMESQGFMFVGCGISGGAEGALKGPSIMPGGSFQAWDKIKFMFQAIAAKNEDNNPCCEWIGPEGSGHFVKMVHNGIEYALMQLIAESYDIMKRLLFMSADEICSVTSEWNSGALNSYLMEITRNILKVRDTDSEPLIDNILDCAAQKGTGRDISISALELGVPVTAISESINARLISTMTTERSLAAHEFINTTQYAGDRKALLKVLEDALYCSQIIVYMQGFSIIAKGAIEYKWDVDLTQIARIWQNGCIIRSKILKAMCASLKKNLVDNVLLNPTFKETIKQKHSGWRKTIMIAITHGIPVPVLSSTLSYFDGICSEHLPANLIQAQRDYFGLHGYEKINASRGIFFHSKWDR